MPRGFAGVRDVAAQQKARGESQGEFTKWLKIDDGGYAVVRFLEQGDEIHWAWVHGIPVQELQYPKDVPCLDQNNEGRQCPACESDNEKVSKRRFKGFINVIWRDAPVREKQGDRWVQTGTKDQIAVWSSGIRVFEDLDTIDVTYKGLRSRDFRIMRKGVLLKTTYTIMPADVDGGAQPLSAADEELATTKYDLTQYTSPLTAEEMYAMLSGESSGGGVAAEQVQQTSVFQRRSEGGGMGGNIFAGR